ncbi:MAG: selenide, water dikinase SelD [Bacteroidia bacterium]|nr:selenide, water dikinase SelD [Bacteroidia bacterium]
MIHLTEYAHAAGCGCKIAPAVLKSILKEIEPGLDFPSLLVGNSTNDDAAVWEIGNGLSLINTVDFFMPIVDDAFDFGRIAAANAISDIYAMGGKPHFANAILGWPVEQLPANLAAQVLNGARTICELAGIPLAGGHSVDAKEPFFGLSVTGSVLSEHIKRNNTGGVGDVLFLTKPLGTGIISTGVKRKLASAQLLQAAISSMVKLNSLGEQLASMPEVTAITDITGFGFLGHLIEMAESSGVSASIDVKAIQAIEGIDELLSQNCVPDNTYRNWNAIEQQVDGMMDMRSFQLLNDPQTSGGLLIAVREEAAPAFSLLLEEQGLGAFKVPVGRLVPSSEKLVQLKMD